MPPAVVLLGDAATVLSPDWLIQHQALLGLAALASAWSFLDPRIPLAVAALSRCAALTNLSSTMLYGSIDSSALAAHIATYTIPPLLLITAAILGAAALGSNSAWRRGARPQRGSASDS